MRKHFHFINLVPLTICSANPQDMSHEIKFVRTFSLSSLMHKWRRMIIWQNWPIILFGVCKFSPFRVKTKEFLILTLNRFMCISAKKNWLHKFIRICIEGGEKAGQCSGKAYLAIREGGNLWRRQGILLQRGNLEILENQEPAFPGPVIDGIIVNNRVIEVYLVKVSLRESLNALLKQRRSQAGPTDTRTYGILYSKSLILKLDNSWLYPFPSD